MSLILSIYGSLHAAKAQTPPSGALPSIVQKVSVQGTQASHSFALPAATGNGVLLLFATGYNTEVFTAAGFTLIGGGKVSGSSAPSLGFVFAKNVSAGDSGSVTVAATNASFGHIYTLVEVADASAARVALEAAMLTGNSEANGNNRFTLNTSGAGLRFALISYNGASVESGTPWDTMEAGNVQSFARATLFSHADATGDPASTVFYTGGTGPTNLYSIRVGA